MTVRELMERLQEIPPELRDVAVQLETESEGGELRGIRARTGDGKIWWMASHIVLSTEY